MRLRGAALTFVAFVAAACAPPGSGQGSDAPPNLVLITVDTLRADHLRPYGYFRQTSPVVDALAEEAMLFENVIAPMATTLPSHTSLLTSTYPARHGVLSNFRFFKQPIRTTDELQTVAQMLRQAGYDTAAFTSSSPLSEATGIQSGFRTFRGPPPYETNDRRIDIPAAETTSLALDWLERAEPPFFLWIHLFDPHHPYMPPAPFDEKYAGDLVLPQLFEDRGIPAEGVERATELFNLYDGEIFYADGQIGRILTRLRDRGLYDDSVIVFTADHGEGLYQHGILEHGWIWNEQIRVPLVIRFPDGRTGRSAALASLLDVLPTLAEETALPLQTTQFDGINLFRESRRSALSQREVRESVPNDCYTLTDLEWKYWYFNDQPDRLFHLRNDPHETANVISAYPEVASRMKSELLELIRENQERSPLRLQENIPEHLREKLRSLGYVN